MFMLQMVVLYCGSFSANPIHVFEVFVMDYINKAFQVVSEFNEFMTKICSAASAQNSLMSFLNVFCSEPQHPLEHDDVLQPQNIESAKSSVKVLNSDWIPKSQRSYSRIHCNGTENSAIIMHGGRSKCELLLLTQTRFDLFQ